MERNNFITEKILDSMKSIFAFSRSRVSDATEAEDLSQQIITELLSSADALKNENAFYGWMWAVAKNTYSNYIRARKKENFTPIENENYISDSKADVENNLLKKEDINILRREMSFLAHQYREAVVKYYIEEKSCSQISAELSVTVETVKNLLFKARKILKEGINMERKYGEKSYNPDILRVDKWVSDGAWEKYQPVTAEFEKKRLPGNILLSTYYSPMTVEELSVELGVSAPYIEDELNAMLKSGLIKLLPKARYQANIFIYTDSCDEEIAAKTKNLYKGHSQKFIRGVDKMIPAFSEMLFKDSDVPQNNLRWFVSHFVLWHAALKNDRENEPMPLLPLGGRGYLWGYNYDYKKGGFQGIYGKCTSENYDGWVHAANYRLLEKCQVLIGGYQPQIDFLLAAAHKAFDKFTPDVIAQYIQWCFIEKDGDSYKSLCPTMTEAQYKNLCELCAESINESISFFAGLIDITSAVMENHAPEAVKEQYKPLAGIKADGIAEIMGNLCESGYLMIPQNHSFLTIYAVI
jgi:RNA polymerase sigma factor (sigma-70 family)